MARKNGWQAPFHVLQVVTWVMFPTIMALFFVFYTPLLQTTAAYVGTAAYVVACLFTVYAVFVCTKTDPSDDCILRPSTINRDTRASEDQVYCNVCMQYVHKESRHCRLCNKCVAVFDHHCKWLNNCVGQKNYRFFLASVVGATVLLALQLALGAVVFYETFANPDTVRRRATSAFGCSNASADALTGLCATTSADGLSLLAIQIVHGILLAFLAPSCFLIAQLTFFHIHLCIENITTYDYIVRKRKREMNRLRGVNNASGLHWWQRICACCFPRPPPRASENDKSQDVSNRSANGDVDEHDDRSNDDDDAAIEAEVDDDLDVLSQRSSEVDNDDTASASARRRASRRQSSSGGAPRRGFGLHVNLAAVTSATTASTGSSTLPTSSIVLETPTTAGASTSDYVLAPQTPRSPRSDAESAYRSDNSIEARSSSMQQQVGDSNNSSATSSVVMYGRPGPSDTAAHHIV